MAGIFSKRKRAVITSKLRSFSSTFSWTSYFLSSINSTIWTEKERTEQEWQVCEYMHICIFIQWIWVVPHSIYTFSPVMELTQANEQRNVQRKHNSLQFDVIHKQSHHLHCSMLWKITVSYPLINEMKNREEDKTQWGYMVEWSNGDMFIKY